MNSAAFEQLLATLHPDRDRAGTEYCEIHRRLIKFFEWQCCPMPDAHADEVMDRVQRRITDGMEIQDVMSYAYGVARLLLHEIRKEMQRSRSVAAQFLWLVDRTGDGQPPADAADSQRQICFDRCVEALDPIDRMIILNYYAGEHRERIDARKQLAKSLGTDLNALRVRAHRIRTRLEQSVGQCVKQSHDRRSGGRT